MRWPWRVALPIAWPCGGAPRCPARGSAASPRTAAAIQRRAHQDGARARGRTHLPERVGGYAGAAQVEIGMVQEVDRLHANGQVDALAEWNRLVQAHVEAEAGSVAQIDQLAERARGRGRGVERGVGCAA